jgi:endoglucanase
VTHVSLVAPDILALEIDAQHVQRGALVQYVSQPGDKVQPQKRSNGTVKWSWVIRDGKPLGHLYDSEPQWMSTPERLIGDPLLAFYADDVANFTITSPDHPAFAQGVKPVAAYRKSEPSNIVLPGNGYAVTHRVYLKLPEEVETGKHYQLSMEKLNVQNAELSFAADLSQVRSESVHVNQIGYRPSDPTKQAFLSIWLGTGGGYTFPEGLRFTLIDDTSGQTVHEGQVKQVMAEDGTERLWTKPPKNYSKTAVYQMDFSDFNKPGRYRIYVNGIGCSYPFDIQEGVWQHAFLTQMKGLYTQRSGVELGPPYTQFKRPPDFNPANGAVVTRSTYDVLKSGQFGSNVGKDIVAGDTGEPISNAWGGYHDAGDWNPRRVTHMSTTLAQLELVELFPDYFNTLKLSIPPTQGVPDIITEALFEIDCFRRIQHDDGAVPYGIETEDDPLFGELSWLSNQHAYVLAPNIRDSWLYAAVAARAAKVLRPIKPELAEVYLDSATRAFDWAEKTYASMQKAGEKFEQGDYWQAFDARNLSALVLYDITDNQHYHDVFKQTTCLTDANAEATLWGLRIQSDAMFLYTRMDRSKVDETLFKNACNGIRKLAERSLNYAKHNAFNITQREPGRPMFAGFFSTSGGTELVRAHFMTGSERYLAGAVQSCQFQSGCNPNNLVYTTGLGANPVKNPLEVDARGSGQEVPVGLTVFGNSDYFNWPNSFWDINLRYANQRQFLWPNAYDWPLTEAYFDVWILVSANEYVVDTWAPNVLVWGYLAARK